MSNPTDTMQRWRRPGLGVAYERAGAIGDWYLIQTCEGGCYLLVRHANNDLAGVDRFGTEVKWWTLESFYRTPEQASAASDRHEMTQKMAERVREARRRYIGLLVQHLNFETTIIQTDNS